jgi:hypothetical protein
MIRSTSTFVTNRCCCCSAAFGNTLIFFNIQAALERVYLQSTLVISDRTAHKVEDAKLVGDDYVYQNVCRNYRYSCMFWFYLILLIVLK